MRRHLFTHVDIEIPRPAEQVWAVVTDYATDTIWRKGITEMIPDPGGPPHVGTKAAKYCNSAAASTSPTPPSPKSDPA